MSLAMPLGMLQISGCYVIELVIGMLLGIGADSAITLIAVSKLRASQKDLVNKALEEMTTAIGIIAMPIISGAIKSALEDSDNG